MANHPSNRCFGRRASGPYDVSRSTRSEYKYADGDVSSERSGDFAQAGPALTNLIGRPPKSSREVLKESSSRQQGGFR